MNIIKKIEDTIISWRNKNTLKFGDNPSIEDLRGLGRGLFCYRKFNKTLSDGFDGAHNSGTVGNGIVYNGGGGGFIIHQKGNGEIYIKALLTGDSTSVAWTRLNPSTYQQLDTPYHATKMQQQGIYEDFISYMDSQHEYDKEQKALESTKQEAYQLALVKNSELVYEDWLSSYPELMPVHQEPVPSKALQEFYNEYK